VKVTLLVALIVLTAALTAFMQICPIHAY